MSFPLTGYGSVQCHTHFFMVNASTFNSPFIGKDLESRQGLGLLAVVMTVRLVCI